MEGSFELITGPMSCGKTEELLRRINRALIAKKQVKIFSPNLDTREGEDIIKSRNGLFKAAIKINKSTDIINYIDDNDEIVAIDEAQFFDNDIIAVIQYCLHNRKKVIACGLDLDFKGDPFGAMPQLLCLATKVDKLTAVCMKCGRDNASRTQRLINGEPASKRDPLIAVEGKGKETYEARCLNCWEIRE